MIAALLDLPGVETAIKLGSPGLVQRARSELAPAKLDSVLVSLTKYLIRMATRCTPYSAFATVGLGRIAPTTPVSHNIAQCRLELDCGVLASFDDHIKKRMRLHGEVVVRLNPTAYRNQDEIRYFERQFNGEAYEFALARVSRTPYLDLLFGILEPGPMRVAGLVASLRSFDSDLTDANCLEYIGELLQSRLLAGNVDLRITSAHPLLHYLRSVEAAFPGAGPELERQILADVADCLMPGTACRPDEALSRVEQTENRLADTSMKVVPGRTVHVDSFAEECDFALPHATLSALATTIERLHALFPLWRNPKLADFAQAFEKRFGDRFVPLVSALDPETGIPFGLSSSIIPWMSRLGVRPSGKQANRDADASLHALLAGVLTTSKNEIDLDQIAMAPASTALPLAPSFSVNATFFQEPADPADQTGVRAHLHYFSAPGSTNLIARFAALQYVDYERDNRICATRDRFLSPSRADLGSLLKEFLSIGSGFGVTFKASHLGTGLRFDGSLKTVEDTDLFYSVVDAGFLPAFLPSIEVRVHNHHNERLSACAHLDQRIKEGHLLLKKHAGFLDKFPDVRERLLTHIGNLQKRMLSHSMPVM